MVLADKRELRHKIRRVEKVKTWQLIIVLLMFGFVTATFLRLNNVGMIERRDAVEAADKAGDRGQLERRLYDLQRYVSEHMNTSTGRIALEHTYQADNDAHLKKLTSESPDSNPNGNVYAKAAEVCDPIGRAQGWRWPDPRYTNCLNQELEKYPSASLLQDEMKPLAPEPYYHNFASPRWSPDFAGWSLLVCGLILLVIIIRLVILGVLKLLISRQYRRA